MHAALPYAESLGRGGDAGHAAQVLAAGAAALPPGTHPAEIMADWDKRCAAGPAGAEAA